MNRQFLYLETHDSCPNLDFTSNLHVCIMTVSIVEILRESFVFSCKSCYGRD